MAHIIWGVYIKFYNNNLINKNVLLNNKNDNNILYQWLRFRFGRSDEKTWNNINFWWKRHWFWAWAHLWVGYLGTVTQIDLSIFYFWTRIYIFIWEAKQKNHHWYLNQHQNMENWLQRVSNQNYWIDFKEIVDNTLILEITMVMDQHEDPPHPNSFQVKKKTNFMGGVNL